MAQVEETTCAKALRSKFVSAWKEDSVARTVSKRKAIEDVAGEEVRGPGRALKALTEMPALCSVEWVPLQGFREGSSVWLLGE